nr:hypothetical protein CFP56_65189 [Quercus suber]
MSNSEADDWLSNVMHYPLSKQLDRSAIRRLNQQKMSGIRSQMTQQLISWMFRYLQSGRGLKSFGTQRQLRPLSNVRLDVAVGPQGTRMCSLDLTCLRDKAGSVYAGLRYPTTGPALEDSAAMPELMRPRPVGAGAKACVPECHRLQLHFAVFNLNYTTTEIQAHSVRKSLFRESDDPFCHFPPVRSYAELAYFREDIKVEQSEIDKTKVHQAIIAQISPPIMLCARQLPELVSENASMIAG